jgi:hypothetical protein
MERRTLGTSPDQFRSLRRVTTNKIEQPALTPASLRQVDRLLLDRDRQVATWLR